LDACLAEVLGGFDVHHLLAGAEGHLNGPTPGELNYDPTEAGFEVGGEQVAVTHPPGGVADHHHLDRPVPQYPGPDRLVGHRQESPRLAVSGHLDLLPQPLPSGLALAVCLLGRVPRAGQARPLLGLRPTFVLRLRGYLRVIHGRVAAHPPDEVNATGQLAEHLLAGVSAVAYEGKVAAGEVADQLG